MTIGNNKHIGSKFIFFTIKRGNFFTLSSVANNNLFICQIVVVKRMHRLSCFKHNKVGNVNNVVNWTHARSNESFLHPNRRWFYAKIFNNAANISWAKVIVLNLYVNISLNIFAYGCIGRNGWMISTAKYYRCLFCNTHKAVAIRAICGDFKVNDIVVKT